MCYNCVDRHIDAGDGDITALIYESAYLNISEKWTYKDMQNRVGRIASIFKNKFGIEKGDRVLLYMPMIPVSAFAMLACARIGAIHSVVFGGFAAKELANRIEDCKPKLIITASCGLEPGKVIKYRPIVDEAVAMVTGIENAHKSIKRLFVQRKDKYEDKDFDKDVYFDYDDLMADEQEVAECTPVLSTHPLYILCKLISKYSSTSQNLLTFIIFRYLWNNRRAQGCCKRHRWHCGSAQLDYEKCF